MEEEKAAAYYDELSRKGEGAAKFKQGLGFSSSSSSSNPFPFKKTSSFSPLSNFVRASSNPKNPEVEKQDSNRTSSTILSSFVRASSSSRNGDGDRTRVLDRIHGKLNRSSSSHRPRSPSDEREKRRRERYDDREREEDKYSSRKSRHIDSDSEHRERRRSRSYSPPRVSRDRERNRKREKDGSSKERRSGGGGKSDRGVDYSLLIEGYSQMTPAERVKAKMKLQLTQTVAKDTNMGMSSGWERFDFNKDAPLDDDEDETEVAEDDVAVVKEIGRSFRFAAVEARLKEEVKAAHDQAMFGGAATSSRVNLAPETSVSAEEDGDDTAVDDNGNHLKRTALISDKVLSMQQGSWRDRARRLQNASEQS